MIVRGLSAAIFFRGIFALAKSKQSRINRPEYFSCFFHYFGSYAYTSNAYPAFYQGRWHSLSSLSSLLSYATANRVSLRLAYFAGLLALFLNYAASGKAPRLLFADPR